MLLKPLFAIKSAKMINAMSTDIIVKNLFVKEYITYYCSCELHVYFERPVL